MMDWLLKLPDSMIGLIIAGGLWFGFNYVVLADRAMSKDLQTTILPACVASLENQEGDFVVPRLGLGEAMGMPELDKFEDLARTLSKPQILSDAEKLTKCECAAAEGRSATKFDYAVSTATFRIVNASSVSSMSRNAIEVVFSGACGAVPGRAGQ